MDYPWYILISASFGLLTSGFIIEKGDSDLIKDWTSVGNVYNVKLQENNQIPGSDRLLLFTIKEAPPTPINWQYGPQIFAHEIQLKNESSVEYEFYITQYIDYETEATHSYLVTIIIESDLIFINVDTLNYDDESPTLTATVCEMKENTDYVEENTTCTSILSDPDGLLSQTSFTIINSISDQDPEDKMFQFSFDRTISDTTYNTTVFLTTLKRLDYEQKIFYSFVVQAKDGFNHSTIPNENVTCIIDVGDQNDMPPQWTEYFTTKQIQEEEPNIFEVTAVDGNRGMNADIVYSLVSYDEGICAESCVTITTENGTGKGIITVEPIDRDARDITTYKFKIMALAKNEPPLNVTLDITFFVDDIDDNSPMFMNITETNFDFLVEDKIADFTFYENFAGTIEGQILIQDTDTGVNAQFSVRLGEDDSKGNSAEYIDAFLIIPSEGYRNGTFQISVKDNKYLDFEDETWRNLSFYVYSEGKNISKEDSVLIKIHLLDYNDEWPIFEDISYTVEVEETIRLGKEIIVVKATDRDTDDAELRHSLIGAEAITGLIEIDSVEGVITVAKDKAFDFDRINPVIFQVQAIDKGNHTTTVSVVITLLDINNKAPTYKVEDVIRVDENQMTGVELNATITAYDVDTTRNLIAEIDWEKSYAMKKSQKLNSSNPEVQKAMQFLKLKYSNISEDSISIQLYVNDNNPAQTAPDYETFDTLYLDITITDINTELPEFADQRSIDAFIVININDINDNAPIFTEETLKKNRTIYERSYKETIVGTIEATDADVGDVTYSCTYVDEKFDWFACDKYGQITSKTDNIDADTYYTFNISVDCIATDGIWITHQVFDIYILDTNNQNPCIKINDSLDTKVVQVKEKSDPDTIVALIGYEDADRDVPFHTVECRINQTEECSESFEIKNNVLTVKFGGVDIDRDTKKAEYSCTPTCYDNPSMEQNDGQNFNTTTTFIIQLIDINDHCPEMLTPELNGTENLKQGDEIGSIIAEDLDEGDNAEIQMNILSVTKLDENEDYTDVELFTMEKDDNDYYIGTTRKRWHLRANKDLRNYYGDYILQLNLTDLGTPPQSTEDLNNTNYKEKAKLQLSIRRYNYYPPVFIFPNANKLIYVLSSEQVPENPLEMYYKNETFSDIEIMDEEDESCNNKWEPKFDVSLLESEYSVRNFFTLKKISRCKTQLQVDGSYDKNEAVDAVSYKLRLTATLDDAIASDGEAEYSSSFNLTLNFVDINDDPVFDDSLGPWEINFQEADATEAEDLPQERRAYYANVLDSDDIAKYYFLKSNDSIVQDTFDVEENEGRIKVKKELDYLETKSYDFQIQAARNRSGIATKKASIMKVSINVTDINNHIPQWTQDSFFGALLKTSQKGSTIVTINARDLDEIDQGKLTYSLNSTIEPNGSESIYNIQKPFLLDQKTGIVTLNFSLDYNMYGSFSFWVKVQDVQDAYGHGPLENITNVTIHIVSDDNTVTFRFENTLDKVVGKRLQILDKISTALKWECLDQSIDHDSQNGIQLDNVTAANIYCIQNNNLLTTGDIKTKLNNINTFQQLKEDLLALGILLQNFNSDDPAVVNLESTLKAALIGVSVVLGALCLILAVTFFLKMRELNRRLKKLTKTKFGSDESNLNRQGVHFPTTNIFAVEGSNPVFNTDVFKKDLSTDEISSIHSANYELIGVEDNPEFDDMFGEKKFM